VGTNASLNQTTLHAQVVERSPTAHVATGIVCTTLGVPGQVTQFTRWFLDINGDGLKDSLAFSSRHLDLCSERRNLRGLAFLSITTGTAFRRAWPIRIPDIGLPNPSIRVTPDRTQSVDPGVRIVDLDRDGREDLLLMTHTEFATSTPRWNERTDMVW